MAEQPDAPADPEPNAASGDLEIPLGIVVARILIVSGMGVAAALGIFFLIGGIWLWGAVGMAIRPGASYNIVVEKVVDDPEKCDEEEESDPDDCDIDFCDPSDYYTKAFGL